MVLVKVLEAVVVEMVFYQMALEVTEFTDDNTGGGFSILDRDIDLIFLTSSDFCKLGFDKVLFKISD